MKPTPPRLDSCLTREILVVFALTVAGGVLRLWSFGRLGLLHFDEGIYAASGLWIFSRHGLLDLDPSVIAYAPPGFPFLVGLSYFGLGVNDLPAILVSVASGTATIPIVAWLALRTFGSGAGGVAAAFAALSGAHVAFSRMALTDVSFLLFWVLALVQGQRFLERPNAGRAVVLGLAVGAAQLFKYHGWLAGAIVVLTAALWLAFHPRQWRSGYMAAIWGWGLGAALVAAAVYWPWFAFVESHGGYGSLVAHQRGYLGGLEAWPGHLAAQLAQARALSGGPGWLVSAGLAAALAMASIAGDPGTERHSLSRVLLQTLGLSALCLVPNLAWWVPLAWMPGLLERGRMADPGPLIFLWTGWVTLSVLTPFYHPYARLWLPLEGLGWLFMAGVFVGVRSRLDNDGREANHSGIRRSDPLVWLAILGATGLAFQAAVFGLSRNNRLPGLLSRSDSLRIASATIARDLPKNVKTLRVFARPPVTFYLGQAVGVAIDRQPSLSGLLKRGDAASWSVLDTALIRQDQGLEAELNRSSRGWVLVRAIPTTLSLPVLLDIDPGAARSGNVGAAVELRLLRPKRAGDLK